MTDAPIEHLKEFPVAYHYGHLIREEEKKVRSNLHKIERIARNPASTPIQPADDFLENSEVVHSLAADQSFVVTIQFERATQSPNGSICLSLDESGEPRFSASIYGAPSMLSLDGPIPNPSGPDGAAAAVIATCRFLRHHVTIARNARDSLRRHGNPHLRLLGMAGDIVTNMLPDEHRVSISTKTPWCSSIIEAWDDREEPIAIPIMGDIDLTAVLDRFPAIQIGTPRSKEWLTLTMGPVTTSRWLPKDPIAVMRQSRTDARRRAQLRRLL